MSKNDYTFCRENINKIENYELALKDNFKNWKIHHRLETHDKWGNKRDKSVPQIILRMLGLYYYRPASELIFLTNSEHTRLHNSIRNIYHWTEAQKKAQSNRLKGRTGRKWSDEEKKAQSERRKRFFENGGQSWNKGKVSVYSEETRRKMSEAKKGKKHTEETKQKMRKPHNKKESY